VLSTVNQHPPTHHPLDAQQTQKKEYIYITKNEPQIKRLKIYMKKKTLIYENQPVRTVLEN
jgi:hypothetical protein